MCLYSRFIRNPKYKSNKKNQGIIPEITDPRVLYVPVGCQECIECMKKKARDWQIRLMEEIKTSTNGKYITLTLNNESIAELSEICKGVTGYKLDNKIAIEAVARFRERWRKKYKTSIKHWLVTELGHTGTENIHLHGLIWTNESYDEIERIWKYGWIWKGSWVNNTTINYIIKYIHKQDEDHKGYKAKVLTSPGMGQGYTRRRDSKNNKYKGLETNETYRTETGHKISIPIYWRNKIYNDEQREKLWLQKLDKNERWICGEKIRADDKEEYYKTIEWYRRKSKELGYGDGSKDYDAIKYEEDRRKIMIMTRINNIKK